MENLKLQYKQMFFDLLIIVFIGVLFAPRSLAQQQQHISWPSLADSPWPFIRGDMQATGRSKYVGPNTNNVLWKKDLPLGILHGPVIGDSDILYFGTEKISQDTVNYFYAVNNKGETIWVYHTKFPSPNDVVPIITKDTTIIFGSLNKSIYALNQAGSLKWQVENINFAWAHCYMTLAKNGDLYFPSSDTLVIIDKYGTIKKKKIITGLKSRAFIFSTGGDTMFFFTGGGGFNDSGAINASNLNGDIFWSYPFATHNLGTPLVDNSNKVYVYGRDSIRPNNIYIYCISPDGTLDWKYQIDGYYRWVSPTMDRNGNVILIAQKQIESEVRNCVISLDYSGNENWIYPFEDDWDYHTIDHGLVCDAEGKIYCGSTFGGYFYCFSNRGELLWQLDIGDYDYDSSPAIGSDGTLYIGLHKGSGIKNLIAVRDTVTSIISDEEIAMNFTLSQNYPNPFNATTHIRYSITHGDRVSLKVFDILGNEITTIIDKYQSAGEYDAIFNGDELPSGIYFYRIKSGNFTAANKMILMR